MKFEDLAPFLPLIAASLVAALLSLFGYILSQRLGLTPQQAKYVDILEGIIDGLEKKLELKTQELEDTVKKLNTSEEEKAVALAQIRDLKQEIFELRTTVAQLTADALRPPDRRPRRAKSEAE